MRLFWRLPKEFKIQNSKLANPLSNIELDKGLANFEF